MNPQPHPVTLVTLERDEGRLTLFATPDCLSLLIRANGHPIASRFPLTPTEARVLSALLLVAAEAMKKHLDTYQPASIT